MKMMMGAIMVAAMMTAAGAPVLARGEEFDLQKADVHDRMTYHRAIDGEELF
jgi:hypothetical protein